MSVFETQVLVVVQFNILLGADFARPRLQWNNNLSSHVVLWCVWLLFYENALARTPALPSLINSTKNYQRNQSRRRRRRRSLSLLSRRCGWQDLYRIIVLHGRFQFRHGLFQLELFPNQLLVLRRPHVQLRSELFRLLRLPGVIDFFHNPPLMGELRLGRLPLRLQNRGVVVVPEGRRFVFGDLELQRAKSFRFVGNLGGADGLLPSVCGVVGRGSGKVAIGEQWW